jgi:hypothetical protein
MNRRRRWLWLVIFAVVAVMLVCLRRYKRLSVTPPPVDLSRHDGETIDFSSGKPVVKNSAADRAVLDKTVQEMDEAAKTVTFGPTPPTAAPKTPPADQ